MLSSKAKYALRAALVLAKRFTAEEWTNAAVIADEATIPLKFLEAILVQLRDHSVVESRRGPSGGHRLTMPPADVSIAEIMRIIDGPIALTPCASRTKFSACADCVDLQECQLRELMVRVRDAAAAELEGCSLADLTRQPELASASRTRAPRRSVIKRR